MQETIVFSKGFSYHAANMLGEGRISPEEVEALAPRIRQAAAGVEKIRKEGWAKNHLSKDGNPEPIFFPRLPYPGSDSPIRRNCSGNWRIGGPKPGRKRMWWYSAG